MRCPRSTVSQSDFHPVIRPFSPLRLGRSYKLALEPDGSPLFTSISLIACWRYEPREYLRPLAIARAAIPPSPLRDRVGYSDHDRFRGYVPVHCRSGLQPPCLRFAATVTGRHARLGTRLLARLCRGRHFRRLSSTRFQGATRSSNRTCRFPASGSPIDFTAKLSVAIHSRRVPFAARRSERTDDCHECLLCAVWRGSFASDRRRDCRPPGTPAHASPKRSNSTIPEGLGSGPRQSHPRGGCRHAAASIQPYP